MDPNAPAPSTADPIIRESAFASDSLSLFRRDVLPTEPVWTHLIVLHGYGDHSGRHLHFMRWMAQHGVACHTFDFRGHGRSPGHRGFVNHWGEYLTDLRAFLSQPDLQQARPLFALGHSHGGLVLAAAAINAPLPLAGAIFTSPYFRNRVPIPWYKSVVARFANRFCPGLHVPSGIAHDWLSSDPQMAQDRQTDPFALPFCTPRWFAEVQPTQRDVLARASEFRLPLLMLLPGDDRLADPDAARQFFNAAAAPDKTLRLLPTMRHEILREIHREEVFEHILQWMRQPCSVR